MSEILFLVNCRFARLRMKRANIAPAPIAKKSNELLVSFHGAEDVTEGDAGVKLALAPQHMKRSPDLLSNVLTGVAVPLESFDAALGDVYLVGHR
jgi:hypothetical protein